MSYAEFLDKKKITDLPTGLSVVPPLNPALFEFQRDIVNWALRRGRAAIFADCGLGKTLMQLEWANHIPGRVLILAPLAVAGQTQREGARFGIEAKYARHQDDTDCRIVIANYEMLHNFDASQFTGIVLDESSILKAFDGKTRNQIIDTFAKTPYKLACTATPAPNDYMELGNHAEFLGTMSRTEMLAMFFVHDGGDTAQWRLKGHAETEYWKWLTSWAVMLRKPSDLGYSDDGFALPEMVVHQVEVKVDEPTTGFLFPVEAKTLLERLQARRDTIGDRVEHCANLIIGSENRVKLAAWHGRKQTIKNATTRSIASEDLPPLSNTNESTPSNGKSTCANTTQTTKLKSGASEHQSSETKSTPLEGSGTQPIPYTGNSISTPLREGTKISGAKNDCDQPLESTTPAMPAFLPNKAADALSAAQSMATNGGINCTSIIATIREKSEGFSVVRAISESESLPMIQNDSGEQWIIWCNLNDEANRITAAIPGAVNIQGLDSQDTKERAVLDFTEGRIRVLVSKVTIFGFGLNLQFCRNMVFLGLSDSYEQFYQAVRRCWRFGQKESVNVYVIAAETEGAVVANIKRKERDAEKMAQSMIEHMQDLNKAALHGATERSKSDYQREVKKGDGWELHLADCVDLARELPNDSLHYSIYSPPFASLYTYSNSDRDMGNCKDDDTFFEHYGFLVDEIYRATMPGRLTSFHCMNLPTSKQNNGFIGIRDFRGDLIRLHQKAGFIFHSEVCIWKDPVTAMQRTKALGLLHKQIKKDSCMSRQGIPDYLVTMRKPGDNPERVTHTNESFPVQVWQKYASPVWMDINPSDTLQFRSAREHNDERHICPLQLQVIERGLELWSNPGDLVFSPFTGIGSEGYTALKMDRRFIGSELKRSYYEQAARNLEQAKAEQGGLFATV